MTNRHADAPVLHPSSHGHPEAGPHSLGMRGKGVSAVAGNRFAATTPPTYALSAQREAAAIPDEMLVVALGLNRSVHHP
jgi:hypothetical protein